MRLSLTFGMLSIISIMVPKGKGVPEMDKLIGLLPDGASVVAVIAVVLLFLKQLDKANEYLRKAVVQFDSRVYDTQKAFQAQILDLALRQSESQKNYQEQIRNMIDANLAAARDIVIAMKSLEIAVAVRNRNGVN